jgi:hypothetical protein
VLQLGLPVPVSLQVGSRQRLVAPLAALHAEEGIVLGLIDCEDGLALLGGESDSLLLETPSNLVELVSIEA